jgi:anhydro-N-acetylmuramic acid kinase
MASNRNPSNLYIGMISGTSRDGVDVVLVRFAENTPELVASLCVSYPEQLATTLSRLIDRRRRPDDDELALVDQELAEFFALSAWAVLDRAGVDAKQIAAIGSHGQTVWHNPARHKPESIQLGNPQRIANLTGIRTVGHFRQADIEAGGQGAPLAPLLHEALLKPANGVRVVLNVGGISNVSVLSATDPVTGYDTGPGNCLLDSWIRKHKGVDYDHNGEWAAGGTVDENFLQRLYSDPYFGIKPPKSTGVEYFNFYWLQGRLDQLAVEVGPSRFRDIQATLSELTAYSVAEEIKPSAAADLLVCGGGAHNSDLIKRLARLLPHTRVTTTAGHGLDPDWVEGILFAWLARERIARRYQDTSLITGAGHPVMLGEVFEPARDRV